MRTPQPRWTASQTTNSQEEPLDDKEDGRIGEPKTRPNQQPPTQNNSSNNTSTTISRGIPWREDPAWTRCRAERYLRLVKRTYATDPFIYRTFLDVMHQYRRGRLSIVELMGEVWELFEEQPNLLLGFNAFLPSGYAFELSAR
ncbi:Paired amphipathic helix protein Sin3a [Balamuthia mandrillaris]